MSLLRKKAMVTCFLGKMVIRNHELQQVSVHIQLHYKLEKAVCPSAVLSVATDRQLLLWTVKAKRRMHFVWIDGQGRSDMDYM